ncbi:2-hydroxy-acid oxidase [Luedemannella flava]|uniref:2-hydroxy-acid oxidase n=1 Tax=Luedemannella flava TaxID=349316 RepID=UPI0031D6E00D
MWTTGGATRNSPAGGLTLRAVARRVFPGEAAIGADPAHRERMRAYLSDLVRPAGLSLRTDVVERGAGHSYGEMAEALLGPVLGEDRAVDLIVLAHAVPDVTPGRATAAYLSHLCPGNRMAFAVCDQGTAAPFTSLNIISEYARTGGCPRALLLVMEQATLPYDAPPATPVPDAHTGVALLWQSTAGPAPALAGLRQRPDVAPSEVADALSAELDAHAPATLIVTATLAAACGPGRVPATARVAPAGMPTTGVWWALGAALDQRRGPVLLADYEPVLGYLSTCAVA